MQLMRLCQLLEPMGVQGLRRGLEWRRGGGAARGQSTLPLCEGKSKSESQREAAGSKRGEDVRSQGGHHADCQAGDGSAAGAAEEERGQQQLRSSGAAARRPQQGGCSEAEEVAAGHCKESEGPQDHGGSLGWRQERPSRCSKGVDRGPESPESGDEACKRAERRADSTEGCAAQREEGAAGARKAAAREVAKEKQGDRGGGPQVGLSPRGGRQACQAGARGAPEARREDGGRLGKAAAKRCALELRQGHAGLGSSQAGERPRAGQVRVLYAGTHAARWRVSGGSTSRCSGGTTGRRQKRARGSQNRRCSRRGGSATGCWRKIIWCAALWCAAAILTQTSCSLPLREAAYGGGQDQRQAEEEPQPKKSCRRGGGGPQRRLGGSRSSTALAADGESGRESRSRTERPFSAPPAGSQSGLISGNAMLTERRAAMDEAEALQMMQLRRPLAAIRPLAATAQQEQAPWRGPLRLYTEASQLPGIKKESEIALSLLRRYEQAKIDTYPTDLHVYTDGSAAEEAGALGRAGWALCVLAYHEPTNEYSFVGYTGGTLDGEHAKDALDAELAASCYALAWTQGFCDHTKHSTKPRLWVHTDNQINIKVGMQCSDMDKQRRYAAVLQHLAATTKGPREVTFLHVRGHQGEPWNELCDVAANVGRRGVDQTSEEATVRVSFFPEHEHHIKHLLHDDELSSRELQRLAEAHPEVYPPVIADECSVFPVPRRKLPPEEIAAPLKRVHRYKKKSGRKQDITIKFVTANVTTALQADRRLHLRDEFLKGHCHVVGLQETRTRGPDDISNMHYHVWSSGRSESQGVPYGCELWIKKTLEDEGGHQHHIQKSAVCVRSCSPRHLLASITSAVISAELMVIHAPCQQRPIQEIEDFWEQMETEVARHARAGRPLVVMADFNWTLHAEQPHVGDLMQQQEEDSPANRFLRRLGLYVPYTHMLVNADGEVRNTSYNANLDGSVVDFIAMPLEWNQLPTVASVDLDIDISHAAVGHLAATTAVTLPPKKEEAVASRRTLAFDARKAFRKEARDKLAGILRAAPDIPWEIEPSTHYHKLTQWLLSRLSEEFPKQQQKSSPLWMSDQAVGLHQEKKSSFKQIVAARRRGERPSEELLKRHRVASNKLKAQTRKDKRETVESILDETRDAFALHDTKAAFAAMKRLRPYKRRPAVMLRRRQGATAATTEEEAQIWLDHWADRLDGEEVEAEDLVRQVHRAYEEEDGVDCTERVRLVPSRNHVAKSILQTKPGKTHGDDLVPIQLWRADAAEAARLLHPIVLKQQAAAQPPMQWMGGCQVPIPKAKLGPMTSPQVARGIMLGSHAEKAVSRIMRAELAAEVKQEVPQTVCGGLQGRATDYALHIRQQFCEMIKKKGKSGAVLFLDLSAAFEKVKREHIRAAFSKEGLKETAMLLHGQHTWLSVPHSDKLLRFRAGVRPGHPVADICFIATVSRTVKKITDKMRLQGRTVLLLYNPERCPLLKQDEDSIQLGNEDCTVKLCEVAYIDDIQFCIMHDKPEGIVEVVRETILDAHEAFEEDGHQLNYSRGKTEVLLHLHGPGTRQIRLDLISSANMLHCQRQQLQVQLRVVQAYNNLGNVQAFKAPANRLAKMAADGFRAATHTVSPQLLRDQKMDQDRKVKLIDLMLSKALYGAETWPELTPANEATISVPYIKAARLALGENWRPPRNGQRVQLDRDENIYKRGYAPIRTHIRTRRLRYLARYLSGAPTVLLALARENKDLEKPRSAKSWLSLVQDDLEWIWCTLPAFCDMQNPAESEAAMEQWCQLIRSRPKWWKKKVAEAHMMVASGEQHEVAREVRRLQRAEGEHQCLHCGEVCLTPQGLHNHMRIRHGMIAAAAFYVDRSCTCLACGLVSPNRPKAIQHLSDSKRHGSAGCLAQCVLGQTPLTADEVTEERLADVERRAQNRRQGRHGADADLGSYRMHAPRGPVYYGPVPLWASV
eukprot:TRINITY_DN20930_c0_g1_i1.p1 TRINITY_DN20930_c0_g1~~TRINITY_DN20930_c0_g1_i1.p1  ORF type:complete len:1955 (+),score=435.48 TRINITY_DN20930_c0_g1_i1:405-6269(+)